MPLSNIATVNRVNIPGEIAHYNISRVNDVHINVSGRDIGSVARDVRDAIDQIDFESGVTATLRGPVETMQSGMSMLGVGLAVATHPRLSGADGAIPFFHRPIDHHVGSAAGAWRGDS